MSLLFLMTPAAEAASAAAGTVEGPYWVGPGHSGSWFQPDRSGEGFILEILPDGNAVAAWFTFPASGEDGEQVWLVAAGGQVRGDTLTFTQVYRPRGGRFGPAFDPAQIENPVWGSLRFRFHDCASATLSYAGPAGYGSGTRELSRITSIDQAECSGMRALAAGGGRAIDGLRSRSGNWFVPGRSGEGWFVEDLPDGRMLVYWFTFDVDGRQLWLTGVGRRSADNRLAVDAYVTRGTRFGAAFDAEAVRTQRWGRLEFDFSDCNHAAVRYAADDAAYGSGTYAAARVTALAGAPCIDGTPSPRLRGSWVEHAPMPAPAQSEHAAVVLDGRLYALGGYGDPRGFKRYDPADRSWSVLSPLPGGRHHLAAFAVDGGIYFVGGDALGGGDQSAAGFRYDVAAARWDAVPELSPTFGSHAAPLNGRVYIGYGDGSLEEFDPRQRAVRRIRAPDATERDHSQVVAFQGEIWMLGGRSPDTRTTAIYDPVAERWRPGPPFLQARGGFAAAVVGEQIVISGGERRAGSSMELVAVTEVYAAGAERWSSGPSLPQAVHGVPGAALGGRFYVVSGSRNAGQASGASGRLYSWLPEP
ncbi:kelch repeat-containing protein [Tahibacter caeni]|uniref:kelch repeat-containing protein n=1 Tax=Tahibacter caeni TaxID=1453545 RepID=UPI00214735B4|nr:kelch repeat-containing protein [Tahibacter caeni]